MRGGWEGCILRERSAWGLVLRVMGAGEGNVVVGGEVAVEVVRRKKRKRMRKFLRFAVGVSFGARSVRRSLRG